MTIQVSDTRGRYSGHCWDPAGCPVPYSEVDLYTACVVGATDSVLIREVSPLQRGSTVLYCCAAMGQVVLLLSAVVFLCIAPFYQDFSHGMF